MDPYYGNLEAELKTSMLHHSIVKHPLKFFIEDLEAPHPQAYASQPFRKLSLNTNNNYDDDDKIHREALQDFRTSSLPPTTL